MFVAGRALALCVASVAGVRRAGAVPSGVCGALSWSVLQVRVSRAVLCRSVPRRPASCCGVLRFGVRCRGALRCGALRCGVPCCLVLCRGGSVEVSLACVVVRSAGRCVAGWWLGGAVRCGWLAGSVLWGHGRAARAGRSGRCRWGCPPRGPVLWSCVPSGSRSLALGAVAVPSSSSGACVVALVAGGFVVWRCGRGGAPRGGVSCGFPCGCSPFPLCRCALHHPCGFRWLGGVRWCNPYGVPLLLRRCWGCAFPGVVRRWLGVGRRWSLRRGIPFLGVCRGACRGVLFLCASVPAPAPSWSLGGFLPRRCVAFGAPSLWAPAPHLGPLRAPLPECPLPSLALPLPVPFPFPVWWWWGAGGALMAQAERPGGGLPGAIGGGFGGCRGGGGPGPRRGGGPPLPLAA